MPQTGFHTKRGENVTRLRVAAVFALGLHLIAGVLMAVVLRWGLETNPDVHSRMAFIVTHRAMWFVAWFSWTAAALGILYFYTSFAAAHQPSISFAVLLSIAAIGPDLAAQAIEIGVLPSLAYRALQTDSAPELFLQLHRIAVLLSGYLANGLYSLTALMLTLSTRDKYPDIVSLLGMIVGISGLALSAAALADSAAGMFWCNVVLVPAILLWLAGIAVFSANREGTTKTQRHKAP
jgi:hypothetical protein